MLIDETHISDIKNKIENHPWMTDSPFKNKCLRNS